MCSSILEHLTRRKEKMALSEQRHTLNTMYTAVVTMARNLPPRSHQDLEKLIRGEESHYMLQGGKFVGFLFQKACVLSSLLAGIHIVATRFSKVKDYFMTDNTVGAVITFLDNKMYNEAMGLWLIHLDLRGVGEKQYFVQTDNLDCEGYVEDFLPNLDDLTFVKYEDDNNDHDMSPSNSLYNGTLGNFKIYGHVYILGTLIDPKLILVNVRGRMGNGNIPPYVITDDYSRKYDIQFLLLGEDTHMVLCVKKEGGGWMLYNNSGTPQFQDFNMEKEIEKYFVFLVAYVHLKSVSRETSAELENDLPPSVVVTVNNRRSTYPFLISTCRQQRDEDAYPQGENTEECG